MTAITIQSKKIVSNNVKDNWALPEPSYRKKKKKKNELSGQSTKIGLVFAPEAYKLKMWEQLKR